jgi:hypothetical protein
VTSACSYSLAYSCFSSTNQELRHSSSEHSGSTLLVTRAVISACPFSLSLLVLVLRLTQSLVTSRLDRAGSNLPVTSACSCFFSSACSSSSWSFQRLSKSFFTGRVNIRSNGSNDFPCVFRLLFRVRYLSFLFLFRSCSLLLRLCHFFFLL